MGELLGQVGDGREGFEKQGRSRRAGGGLWFVPARPGVSISEGGMHLNPVLYATHFRGIAGHLNVHIRSGGCGQTAFVPPAMLWSLAESQSYIFRGIRLTQTATGGCREKRWISQLSRTETQ